MTQRQTRAFSSAILGAILALAGPFLPGGVHLVASGPPGAGHVTELIGAAGGDVLAGTENGQVWRFRDRQWTREHLDLGDHPVMALLDAPGRTPVATAAGLFYPPAGAPPLDERVSSLLQIDQGLLAGTARGVRLLAEGRWAKPGPNASIYCLFSQRRGNQLWLHAGTIGAGVLTAPAADSGLLWQPNNQGLPETLNVFGFATTAGGRLLAGTDKALFWQQHPSQPWQSLFPGLDGKRVLSLHLAAGNEPGGTSRLWIGGDNGLYSLAIVERGDSLTVEGRLQPADRSENQPPLGVSGIVPSEDRLMVSAGSVYEYGPTRLFGWHWISLAGVALILIAGWLSARPEATSADEASS
jgi:hypothetical protein